MQVAEFVALLAAELRDDIEGTVTAEGNTVTVVFQDGTKRTVTVS